MIKKHIKWVKRSFVGGLGLFWSSKEVKMTKCCLVCIRAQAPLEEAWVLWWVPKWIKTTEKDLLETYFDVFSSFLGFILPQTDQNCTFYTIFSSKLPSGRYEASSNWIFAPRSILSPRMTPDPKERRSRHKTYLFFFNSGLYFTPNLIRKALFKPFFS